MKPVRVTHLIGQLGRGGSEHQLFLAASHLDPARIRSDVVVFNPSPHEVYDEPLRAAGIDVQSVPQEVSSIPGRVAWLVRHLSAKRTEVVHSWSLHDNPYAALCGRLAGTRARWGSLRGNPGASAQNLSRFARWLSLYTPDRLVVNTPQLERGLITRGMPEEKILLVPNCVEMHSRRDSEAGNSVDLPFAPGTRLVGSIGNLRAVKNHEMFVRALEQLLPQHEDAAGIIIGQTLPSEPEVGAGLQRQIDGAGLGERIRLLGFRDDVPELLPLLAALSVTSRSEGTPNVILEAMAAGCPVVATEVGGIPDLIEHEKTGLLVPSDDSAALAEGLDRLLTDPSLASQLASAAGESVLADHACDSVAVNLAALYESAVTEGRTR